MAKFDGNIMSIALGMETSISVYLPHDDEKYHKNQKPLRTLILLHGFTGKHSNWHRYTALERYAADNNIAVITPDGGYSMYANMAYGQNYFDYVSTELVEIIHKMFRLPVDRENLFIGGLSMGGYGALKVALTCPDRFSKCIAFSSGTMLGTPEFMHHQRILVLKI